MTLQGVIKPVPEEERAQLRERFLKGHPSVGQRGWKRNGRVVKGCEAACVGVVREGMAEGGGS